MPEITPGNKPLETAKGGLIAPQMYDIDKDKFSVVGGRNHAMLVEQQPGPVETVTLLNGVSVAEGVEYTAATSKYITLEFESDAAATATFSSYLVGPSGKKKAFEGFRKTGGMQAVSVANVGDVVSYFIPAGYKLRIENTAPTPSTAKLIVKGFAE